MQEQRDLIGVARDGALDAAMHDASLAQASDHTRKLRALIAR
jgi:hypothetical protein